MFDLIAEKKIADAIERGELDDLPGAGRPLELDDDALVPEDLRLAYRILKNGGFVPPEVQTLNEISQLERVVAQSGEGGEANVRALRRLALLKVRVEARYHAKCLRKLGR